MNRLPSEFRSTPPSPRTDSVTSSPATEIGHTMWVGWNCTNSMFSSVAPASSASACPSPVYSHEFEVTLKVLPMPPVASTTVGASNTTNAPAIASVLARGDDPPDPPAVLARGVDPPDPPAVLARGVDPPDPPAVLA